MVEGTISSKTFFRASNPEARYRHFLKTYLIQNVRSKIEKNHIIIRTNNIEETALLLLTLHKTILTEKSPSMSNAIPKMMPKKTKENVFVRQLCCTNGISPARAYRLQEHYSTLQQLISDLAIPESAKTIATLLRSRVLTERLSHDLLGSTPALTKGDVVNKRKRVFTRPHQREKSIYKEDRHKQHQKSLTRGGRPILPDDIAIHTASEQSKEQSETLLCNMDGPLLGGLPNIHKTSNETLQMDDNNEKDEEATKYQDSSLSVPLALFGNK